MRGTEDLVLLLSASETLLKKVHEACDGFPKASTCRMFVETYREAAARLTKKFPDHPRAVNLEKADRLASEVIWREAQGMLKETEPLYNLLQDVAVFHERTLQFLLHVDCAVLHHVDRATPLSLDYTPQLLNNYMELFCNAVRLLMLARGMPRQLIIQLHTLLLNLNQVQQEEPVADPVGRTQLIAFLQAYGEPFQKMQSDFQCISGRIGQVLESSVLPAILALSGRRMLQESQLLSMRHALSLGEGDKASLSVCEEGWRGLQWHGRMREWLFYAFLACPGECVRPGALEAMQLFLEDTMRVQIFEEHCEWVHPVFHAHVRPIMMLAKHAALTDRRAHKITAKKLVEVAHEAATASCMEERRHRRILAAQSLVAIAMHGAAQPSALVKWRNLAVAALANAKDEVLWYFLHVNEVPPMGAFKALLGSHQPLKEDVADASIPALLSAMQQTVQLLLQYRTALQVQIVLDMQAAVRHVLAPGLDRVRSAEAKAPNAELLAIITDLSKLASVVATIPTPSPERQAPDLAGLRQEWEEIALKLTCSSQIVTIADLEAAAEDRRFLSAFADLMHQSSLLGHLQSHLRELISLSGLNLHVYKVAAAMRASSAGGIPHLQHLTGWLLAFSYLEAEPGVAAGQSKWAHHRLLPQEGPAAAGLTEEWMQLAMSRVAGFIASLHMGQFEVLEKSLYLSGHDKGSTGNERNSSLLRERRQLTAASEAQLLGAERLQDSTGQHAALEEQLEAATALMRALGDARVTKVLDTLAVCPAEMLQQAVRSSLKQLLPRIAFPNQELCRPQDLENEVSRLWALLQRLSSTCGANLSLAIREASLSHLLGESGLAASIAAWIVKGLIIDSQRAGVVMAPARSSFVTRGGKGVQAAEYTSPSALAALIRTFGYAAAKELSACTLKPLEDAVEPLSKILSLHAAMLAELCERIKGGSEAAGRWLACNEAAGAIGNLAPVLESLYAVAKLLFFRKLLSEAVDAVYRQKLPTLHSSLAATVPDDGAGETHLHSFLDLPPTASSSLGAADPALVRMMKGGRGAQRLQAWKSWPALLGLTLQSTAWGTASFDPELGCLSGRLDGVPTCAPAFAASVLEACSQQGEPCETAAVSLSSFAKLASYGLACDQEAGPLKTIAMRRAWQGRDDDGILESCHFADAMFKSGMRHAGAAVSSGRP